MATTNCGLVNFGNTCFLNSALQALLCLDFPLFPSSFVPTDDSLFHEFVLLRTAIKDNGRVQAIMQPRRFVDAFYHFGERSFPRGQQQDAIECVAYLLDTFHDSHKDQVSFCFGEYATRLAQQRIAGQQAFSVLYLDLPIGPSVCDVETLIARTHETDGKEEEEEQPGITVTRWPSTLIVAFKRYLPDGRTKNNAAVLLEDTLDTQRWLGPVYELRALIHHHGSLTGGHYTASGKELGPGNQWSHFDDTAVRTGLSLSAVGDASVYGTVWVKKDLSSWV